MRKFPTFLSIAFVLVNNISIAQTATVAQTIVGKTICGYQGWFNCYGDGSAVARWKHWSNGTYQSNTGAPAANFVTFEAYPDVSGYNNASLFQTNLGNLGDGSSAKLFSSYKQDVIDTQFHWMQQNGIDGVALQRFIGETFDAVFKANRDSVAARLKRTAEKYQRVFYLMYDISGLDVTKFDSIKTDWQNNMVAKLQLTSSPYYVHQNNKPVVCLWGFGFTDRPGDAAQCLDVINWFKNNGCFVIGGVPTNWRNSNGDSKTGFNNVYASYDMISPWSVGRFGDSTGTDNFKRDYLDPDLTYCNNHSILYQPVVFPGFSWSNLKLGSPQNEIPRNKGEFFWRQVYNIKQSGIGSMYVAMFDEYDEGTAIAKMADSYYSIPNNQYFTTTSADGTYLSSDFYLRLVGKATKAINGTEVITKYVPIPYSVGPIWFRSGFEKKYDAQQSWTDSPEPTIPTVSVGGYNGGGSPECGTVSEINHIGVNSLRYAATDNSANLSSICFRAFDVNIPVNANTALSFWTYPEVALARYVSVDLLLSDGTRLSNSGATDTAGVSMAPSTGRGTANTWFKTTSQIGNWLNGKTITKILVAYDHAVETGNFRGYVDDIAIYERAEETVPLTLLQFDAKWNNNNAYLQWTTTNEINADNITVEKSYTGNSFSYVTSIAAKNSVIGNNYRYEDNAVSTNFKSVFYRLKFIDKDGSFTYSKIESLPIGQNGTIVKLFPNPASSYVQISITSAITEKASINITDATGRTVIRKTASLIQGPNTITIDGLSKLAKGFYNVIFISDEQRISLPLIVE